MKNYIFLNTTIANVGGAERYISNKCEHLKKLQYNVYVFSFEKGDVIIPNLKEFQQYVLPELKVPFQRSTATIRNVILSAFLNLQLKGSIIIESNINNLNFWGEFIAQKLGAYHICYLLPENNILYNKKTDYEYYKFKYNQGSLYGITDHTIADMMNDGYSYLGTHLKAVGCSYNAVDDVNVYDIDNWKKADFNILSLGRLNKPYITYMLDAVIRFAHQYENKTINLIIIGGYITRPVSKLLNWINTELSNVVVYNLGEITPISKNLFEIADVAIAVAGCANICKRQGLPTITIDAKDFKGIGILGITTDNSTFRGIEDPIAIEELMGHVLVDKLFQKSNLPKTFKIEEIDYSQHDQLLHLPAHWEYYKVSHRPDTITAAIIKFLLWILGCKNYFRVISRLKKNYD